MPTPTAHGPTSVVVHAEAAGGAPLLVRPHKGDTRGAEQLAAIPAGAGLHLWRATVIDDGTSIDVEAAYAEHLLAEWGAAGLAGWLLRTHPGAFGAGDLRQALDEALYEQTGSEQLPGDTVDRLTIAAASARFATDYATAVAHRPVPDSDELRSAVRSALDDVAAYDAERDSYELYGQPGLGSEVGSFIDQAVAGVLGVVVGGDVPADDDPGPDHRDTPEQIAAVRAPMPGWVPPSEMAPSVLAGSPPLDDLPPFAVPRGGIRFGGLVTREHAERVARQMLDRIAGRPADGKVSELDRGHLRGSLAVGLGGWAHSIPADDVGDVLDSLVDAVLDGGLRWVDADGDTTTELPDVTVEVIEHHDVYDDAELADIDVTSIVPAPDGMVSDAWVDWTAEVVRELTRRWDDGGMQDADHLRGLANWLIGAGFRPVDALVLDDEDDGEARLVVTMTEPEAEPDRVPISLADLLDATASVIDLVDGATLRGTGGRYSKGELADTLRRTAADCRPAPADPIESIEDVPAEADAAAREVERLLRDDVTAPAARKAVSPDELNRRLCAAVGLDSEAVVGYTLHVEGGNLPELTVRPIPPMEGMSLLDLWSAPLARAARSVVAPEMIVPRRPSDGMRTVIGEARRGWRPLSVRTVLDDLDRLAERNDDDDYLVSVCRSTRQLIERLSDPSVRAPAASAETTEQPLPRPLTGDAARVLVESLLGQVRYYGDDLPGSVRDDLTAAADWIERMSTSVGTLGAVLLDAVDTVGHPQPGEAAVDMATRLVRSWHVTFGTPTRPLRQSDRERAVRIVERAIAAGRDLTVWTRDTGPGVPQQLAERLLQHALNSQFARQRSHGTEIPATVEGDLVHASQVIESLLQALRGDASVIVGEGWDASERSTVEQWRDLPGSASAADEIPDRRPDDDTPEEGTPR